MMSIAVTRPSQLSWTALLATAMVVASIVGCSDAGADHSADAGPPGRGVYVPATWRLARGQPGHDVHVVAEKTPCTKCHTLDDTSMGKIDPQSCAECHEKEATFVHDRKGAEKSLGPGATSDCMTCHAFKVKDQDVDAGPPLQAADCRRCHMERQGNIPAVRVHGTRECVTCHEPHREGPPKSAPCTECHGEARTLHAAAGKDATGICVTCHKHQHATADEARSGCATCHATTKPIVPKTALFDEGHSECIACHRPHQFEKSMVTPCRNCHADLPVLGGGRIGAHNQCANCHKPHDVRHGPDQVCKNCHTDKHPDHSADGKAGTCVGCHNPHTPAGHNRARACSSCHQSSATDSDFHGGTACRKCHVPHDFVRPASDHSACRACHEKQLTATLATPGHQNCGKCHQGLPHRPTKLHVGCESCHGEVKKAAIKGHSQCANCHEPHSGKQTATCKSCHQKEHASAPAAHRDCTQCHQPHSGKPTKSSCGACHASEAQSQHGNVAQGCMGCHRPHGPGGVAKPPACSSCHTTSQLPGLHRIAPHEGCARCHDGHTRAVQTATRAACLACHTESRDHHPEAQICTGCHLFR